MRWLTRLVVALTTLVGIVSLVPAHWMPGIGLLAMFLPLLLVPHLLLSMYWLRRSFRYFAVNALLLGLLLIPLLAQFPLHKHHGWGAQEDVRLVSFNLQGFYKQQNAATSIAQWLSSHDADLLAAQEVRFSQDLPLRKAFKYRTEPRSRARYGVAIYSNYPIIFQEHLVFSEPADSRYNRTTALLADIATPTDTFRVINVHLMSTGLASDEFDVAPQKDSIVHRGVHLLKKLRTTDRVRSIQGHDLLKWVQQSPYPVILSGDFNQVPAGAVYAKLLLRLSDPYLSNGSGAMGSFEPLVSRRVPIRIDWTLLDRSFEVYDQFIDGSIHLSDHRPLITIVQPPRALAR